MHVGLEEVVAEELRRCPYKIWDVQYKLGKAGVDFRCATRDWWPALEQRRKPQARAPACQQRG
jgi:hypothetical protein